MNQHQEKEKEAKESGRWSTEEHQRFMLGIMQYGKDWKKVQQLVGTRTGSQVRSHAQKFFNKIQKEQKETHGKHPIPKQQNQYSETENGVNITLNHQHNDDNTPVEIVSLIKKESQHQGRVNLSNLKKSLQSQQYLGVEEGVQLSPQANLFDLKRQSSFRSMNNILSAYENINEQQVKQQEDEGFLILLAKKYKKFFSKDGEFEGLIDLKNPSILSTVKQAEKSVRKRSFALLEGQEQDQQKLESIKKKIKIDLGEANGEANANAKDKIDPNHEGQLLI